MPAVLYTLLSSMLLMPQTKKEQLNGGFLFARSHIAVVGQQLQANGTKQCRDLFSRKHCGDTLLLPFSVALTECRNGFLVC